MRGGRASDGRERKSAGEVRPSPALWHQGVGRIAAAALDGLVGQSALLSSLCRAATISCALILLAVAAVAGGCAAGSSGGLEQTPAAAQVTTAEEPAGASMTKERVASAPKQLQVVIDTSASLPMTYNLRALDAIADVVKAWPKPLPPAGGSPPYGGLTIQVRGVSGVSYAPESVLGSWRVGGIPGVDVLPVAVTPDFTQRVIAHKRQRTAAQAAYKNSRTQAHRVAMALRRLRPKTTYVSEIHGAVSAAAQSFSPRGGRKLLLISDLEQNRAPQIAGSLKDVHMLIVHICRKAASCRSHQASWDRELRRRGVLTVAFIRIERLDAEIETFLRGT